MPIPGVIASGYTASATLTATLKASGMADLVTSAATSTEALSAITFTAGNLIVIAVQGTFSSASAAGAVTAAATSHTFTTQATAYQGTGDKAGGEILTAPAIGGSTVITITSGVFTVYGLFYAVWEISGQHASPIGGVAQVADNTTDGAKTITLSSAPAASSIVLAAACADTGTGVASMTTGTGWTQDAANDAANPNFGQAHYQRRTGSTSTSVTWDDVRAGAATTDSFCGLAIELKSA